MNFVDDLLLSLKSEIARIYDKNELNLPEEETRKMISMIQQIVNKREKNRKPKDFTQSKKYLNTLKGSNKVPINGNLRVEQNKRKIFCRSKKNLIKCQSHLKRNQRNLKGIWVLI
jgi:hypothetical protein